MNRMKKVFRLTDMKYPWLLLISVAVFITSLCLYKYFPGLFSGLANPNPESPSFMLDFVIYVPAFVTALVWSILNYMSHLKLNAIYKRYDEINAFVEHMAMNKEEKAELIQYLNDFVGDLEEKGDTHEAAVKKAINHFRVQEFTEAHGGEIFEKPTHDYLLGYVSIFIAFVLVIRCIGLVVSLPFALSVVSATLVLYGIGFLGLFFLYKLIDVMMAKK